MGRVKRHMDKICFLKFCLISIYHADVENVMHLPNRDSKMCWISTRGPSKNRSFIKFNHVTHFNPDEKKVVWLVMSIIRVMRKEALNPWLRTPVVDVINRNGQAKVV